MDERAVKNEREKSLELASKWAPSRLWLVRAFYNC